MRCVYGFLDELMDGSEQLLTGEGQFVSLADLGRGDEVVLFAPGTDVNVVSAVVPVRSDAEAERTVPYIVEDDVAVPVEDTHFALGASNADIQVARALHIVALSKMDEWSAWLASQPQLQNAKLIAEQSVLPAGEVYLVDGNYIGHIGERVFVLSDAMPSDVIEACVQNHTPDVLAKDEFLQVLMQRVATTDGLVDLRQGAFRKRVTMGLANFRSWRISAALAAALVFALGLTTIMETASLRTDARQVEAAIASAYAVALPDAPKPDNYVQAVSRAVNSAGNTRGITFREGSATLYGALLDVPGAQLLALRYDREDGELVATVSYSAYGDDTALKAALVARHNLTVRLGDARQENAGVVGDIIIQRGG